MPDTKKMMMMTAHTATSIVFLTVTVCWVCSITVENCYNYTSI